MEIDPRITQHRTHFYLKTLKEGKNDIERWIAVSFIIILEYYINIICDGLQIHRIKVLLKIYIFGFRNNFHVLLHDNFIVWLL